MVLATLKDSDIKVETIEDLTNPNIKVIAIANPEHGTLRIGRQTSY